MTTLIRARCHCGLNEFKIPFDTAKFPISTHMCHCNTCRHSTGALSVVDPDMDGEPLSMSSTVTNLVPGDLSNLSQYNSSPRLTRFFCKRCSAHVFIRTNVEDGPTPWSVHWGMLERTDDLFIIDKHIYVGDTLDGGMADWISTFADKRVRRLRDREPQSTEELPVGFNKGGARPASDTLPLRCACGNINIYLIRSTRNHENDAWLASGEGPNSPPRFKATHCFCSICRECSGGQCQSYLGVYSENIIDAVTKKPINVIDPGQRLKGLITYASSSGYCREHCGICGAAVFWRQRTGPGSKPLERMAVAAGLIDEVVAGGARAESWVAWEAELLFEESAISQNMVRAMKEGMGGV